MRIKHFLTSKFNDFLFYSNIENDLNIFRVIFILPLYENIHRLRRFWKNYELQEYIFVLYIFKNKCSLIGNYT